MFMLPSALLRKLMQTPRVIVSPVGVGFGQDSLTQWAHSHGYNITSSLRTVSGGRVLWQPRSRTELLELPQHVALPDVLIVTEDAARLDFASWAAALPEASERWRRSSYAQTDGWPAALQFAQRLAEAAPAELHHNPLVTAYLNPLLPQGHLREVLVRAASTPLLTPELYDLLNLRARDVDALYDGGWLLRAPRGFSLPRLLRKVTAPHVTAREAHEMSRLLCEAGLEGAALDVLAEGNAWEAYLSLLARHAKTTTGEDGLRDRLRSVPNVWRDSPPYRYLAGLLSRMRGDFGHARTLYDEALDGASPALAPLIQNARGVILAMQNQVDEALTAFEAATNGRSSTAGEAWHNRALLLIKLRRHTEAEESLREAVSAFRVEGDEPREARSLGLLGSLYTERGLLSEAARASNEALRLLERGGHDLSAFTVLNLAWVLTLLGRHEEAEQYFEKVRAITTDARALGWLERNIALLDLQRGQLDRAQNRLETLLASQPSDQHLRAEASLLLARALRERGETQAALERLDDAASLGLRADLERSLLTGEGLDDVIHRARSEGAQYELALALVASGNEQNTREALELTRTHGYAALLEGPEALKLAAQAYDDESSHSLFPLRLTVLGPLEVRFAGRTLHLSDFPTRKSAALLLALAFSSRPINREELAERFWPDAKNSLGSLQTAVYHLRGALGVPVVRNERGLLSLAFPVLTDVSSVSAAVQAVRAQDTDDATRSLAIVLRQAGPFLPEFPDEFEEERTSVEAELREARWLLVERSAPGSEEQRDTLRALLTHDPYDFPAREQLIRYYEARGDQEAASDERRRLTELEREFS